MSSIVTEQGLLHYESIGHGKPLILLHGWINSWSVWRDAMIALSKTGQFRVYALDFWGFGDSAKGQDLSSSYFKIEAFSTMVDEFMETLGITEAPIFGHSMGGTVALKIALMYPARVTQVAIAGSPIVGDSLNIFLQLAGYGRIAKLIWRYPFVLRSIMHILLAGDSKPTRKMIFRDVQQTTIESFFRSIGDLRNTDLRQELTSVTIPTLGIFGKNDKIVSPNNANLLSEAIPHAQVEIMNESRHFPMLDEPAVFLTVLEKFLNSNGN